MEFEAICIKIASDYLTSELGIQATDYRMVYRGPDPESGLHIVDADHKDDLSLERALSPGAGSGKSRRLHIDIESNEVRTALKVQ